MKKRIACTICAHAEFSCSVIFLKLEGVNLWLTASPLTLAAEGITKHLGNISQTVRRLQATASAAPVFCLDGGPKLVCGKPLEKRLRRDDIEDEDGQMMPC